MTAPFHFTPRLLTLLGERRADVLDVADLALALAPSQAEVVAAIVQLAGQGLIDPTSLRPTSTQQNTQGTSGTAREASGAKESTLAEAAMADERIEDRVPIEEQAPAIAAPAHPVRKMPPAAKLRPTGSELYRRIVAEVERRGITQAEASAELFGHKSQLAGMRTNRSRAVRAATLEKVEAWLSSSLPQAPEAAPTGAELAAELDAVIAKHGLSTSLVAQHLFGTTSGIARLRRIKPFAATVAKVRDFIAAPNLDLVGKRTLPKPFNGTPRPAPRDPTQKPDTPLMDAGERQAVKGARFGAAINRGREQHATALVDAGADPAKQNSQVAAQMREIQRRRGEEARQQDPVEQAKLALQRKGRTVYSAEVAGGKKGHFHVSGQRDPDTGRLLELTPAALIAEAERVTGQTFRREGGRG